MFIRKINFFLSQSKFQVKKAADDFIRKTVIINSITFRGTAQNQELNLRLFCDVELQQNCICHVLWNKWVILPLRFLDAKKPRLQVSCLCKNTVKSSRIRKRGACCLLEKVYRVSNRVLSRYLWLLADEKVFWLFKFTKKTNWKPSNWVESSTVWM